MKLEFLKSWNDPVDGASLGFIRFAFAATMVYWLSMEIVLDKISYNFYEPSYLFPYFGFEWLKLWPGRGLHLHAVITVIACLELMIGAYYRFCSLVFAFGGIGRSNGLLEASQSAYRLMF